jgi:hypothetical protein
LAEGRPVEVRQRKADQPIAKSGASNPTSRPLGFADPGRAPNYWKLYSLEKFDDAGIAHELLTLLSDVYGYNGASKLVVRSEKGL